MHKHGKCMGVLGYALRKFDDLRSSQAIVGTVLEVYSLCKNYLVQKHNTIPVVEPLRVLQDTWASICPKCQL